MPRAAHFASRRQPRREDVSRAKRKAATIRKSINQVPPSPTTHLNVSYTLRRLSRSILQAPSFQIARDSFLLRKNTGHRFGACVRVSSSTKKSASNAVAGVIETYGDSGRRAARRPLV